MSENITINLEGLSKEEREQLLGLVEKAKRVEKSEKVWKPEYGDWYWYISSDGQVDNCEWVNGSMDLGRYAMGNCFRTREEAEFAREKQKIKTELQRYALEHNDPEKEAWNLKNSHFGLVLKHDTKDIGQTDLRIFQDESVTCFTSASIARDAIGAVGRERILKYIFGVESEGE